ncbi:MAG: APC family permease [Mycoplasmataceae bacterium]|nr:APC family permease [Mycoplasmataceae bacterium]
MSNKASLGKTKNQKFTLKQFAWNGFNLTVGIPFLGSLAILANSPKDTNGAYGLGFHIIWIFLLMGVIASACAFAFAKLSRYHKQDNNGGAYIFARSAFGRFAGFLVLFLNYMIMPMVMSNQILMFIKANVDPTMSTGSVDGGFWWCDWTKHLGNWDLLSEDLLGLLLSAVFAIVAFVGTKTYKKVAKFSLIVKWASSGFLILFGIVAACLPINSGNASNWATNSDFTFQHFLSAFCACFYYFTGFEAFASAGSTVREPEKNISKGIVIVMISSVIFYILMITIFMLAQKSFTQNINTGFWIKLHDVYPAFKWLIYAGPLIMIISTIFMRGNTISQVTLYGGTTLQPMATEGYISNNFANLNEDGFPIKAMKLNIVIMLITIGMWAIVPDIIVGIVGKEANFINVNTIISASSIFYIIIYVFILLALLKYAFEGCIKLSIFEYIIYILAVGVLIVVAFDHFYSLFNDAITNKNTDTIAAVIIEMSFFTLCAVFVLITYFVYYKKKYMKRTSSNSKAQKTLDYEFRTLDGWVFLRGRFFVSALDFLSKRTRFVNQNYENLSDPNFFAEYKHISLKFLGKAKKQLAQYLKYSERIQKRNEHLGYSVKKEIFTNNQEAVKFLSQLQKAIKTKPSDFLYLKNLRK